MRIERLAALSLLGGIVIAVLAAFLSWIFGTTGILIVFWAVVGLVIGTPLSAITLYYIQ